MTMPAENVDPRHHSHVFVTESVAVNDNATREIKEFDSHSTFVLIRGEGIVVLAFFESTVPATEPHRTWLWSR